MTEFGPITPADAKKMSSLNASPRFPKIWQAHHDRPKHLVLWCDKEGIENVTDLPPAILDI